MPALVQAAGGRPVIVHSHCVTGMGPAANLAALQAGADAMWTATAPLANGASLPCDVSMARGLEWMGYDVDLDLDAMGEVAEHFREVALSHGLPQGQPAEYDPRYYAHQMPGGMISNFRAQLRELGMEHRLVEVLEEMPRVREELGFPNIQTPYSQFVAIQAFLNVVHGRYEVIPDEVRRFVLGYWGRTPAPIDQNVLDKAGRGEAPVTGRPGELVEPLLDRVRKEHGPFDSDEDLLLAVFFMPELLTQMRSEAAAAPALQLTRPRGGGVVSIADLVKEAARNPEVKHFSLVAR
jgi:oxaloacetate decarboxylase alpha subunit